MTQAKIPSAGLPSGPAAPTVESDKTLLEFPCRFPIKAMGLAGVQFEALVVEIVNRHAERLTDADVQTRHSRGGKWVSVTLTVQAQSREQLDAIYRDLTGHESVVWVL